MKNLTWVFFHFVLLYFLPLSDIDQGIHKGKNLSTKVVQNEKKNLGFHEFNNFEVFLHLYSKNK